MLVAILFAAAALSHAAESAAGRWEGPVKIPGLDLRLIVDLSEEPGKGWLGSVTVPGFAVKGAQLVDLEVKGSDVAFSIKGALGSERAGKAQLKAHLTADGHLAGDFTQGGNSAPFVLEKTGQAQVDFQTETSKQNKGWVLTADRKFNEPMFFYSSWREAPMTGIERQFNIGAIFSTPLVMNGVVYFGSTDGNLYAVE